MTLESLKQRLATITPPGIKTNHKVKINPDHGAEIADAYDNMEHKPNDPDVKASYDAFKSETKAQYDQLIKGGLKVTKLGKDDAGYTSADEMHGDIKNNKLKYFASEHGFGANAEKFKDHALLTGSGEIDSEGKEMPHNDIFRIVHDIQGHNLGNKSNFSPEGEHAAYLTHKQQYSPLARKALYTETAAQSNWGNFNAASGASNLRKIADGGKEPLDFAEQKTGLIPDSIINKEHHS